MNSPRVSRLHRTIGELDRLVMTEVASAQRRLERRRHRLRVEGSHESTVPRPLQEIDATFVDEVVERIERSDDREALLALLWNRLYSGEMPRRAEAAAVSPTADGTDIGHEHLAPTGDANPPGTTTTESAPVPTQ